MCGNFLVVCPNKKVAWLLFERFVNFMQSQYPDCKFFITRLKNNLSISDGADKFRFISKYGMGKEIECFQGVIFTHEAIDRFLDEREN